MFVISTVLAIGVILLMIAIAIRRTSISTIGVVAATSILAAAALWNAGIIFAFMSPRNRHVFHLSTHRSSVIVNAAIGIVWLSLCVVSVAKWFRSTTVSSAQ